jgi:phenylalanyl-tRNA synthetase beta chain
MLVPIRWLKEFVQTDLTTDQIAHKLTMAGLEAESITQIGAEWDNVFVGYVEKIARHPDADRLVLATVAAGEHRLTVVTGAPNITEDMKVALALAGARLVDPYSEEPKKITLKPSSIRGVRSEGMVCSEKELGLSDEHEGIMVLDDDAPVGTPLRDYLGDDVIEFEITPNLVHAFSVLGIARELAAIIDHSKPGVELADLESIERKDSLVTIEDESLCPRYALAILENVTVGPSPPWLQRRLEAISIRPINNVVDVSNYVMNEIGQPTHPFDADTLGEGRIVVRRGRDGEKLETIDHVKRTLDPDMLVIADAERAVAIAGVMGGVDTEVSDSTTRVLLESASFNSRSIRRTSRGLKLRSDASGRFERGVDPQLAWTAVQRIVRILQQIDPQIRVSAIADAYPQPTEPRALSMPFSEIERLLGMHVPVDDAIAILERLDFHPRLNGAEDEATIHVLVPSYRSDVTMSADLVEEVARIYGYESLPETLPTGTASRVTRDPARIVDRIVQDALVQAGLQQVQTYTMIAEDDLISLSPDRNEIPDVLGGYPRPESNYVRAVNPLRSDWEIMRLTLIPSLLKIIAENLKFTEQVPIFETARTYQPMGKDELPDERRAVCIAMAGAREPFSLYRATPSEYDFFHLKGVIELLLERLGAQGATFKKVSHPSLHPGRAAAIEYRGQQIGVAGELHPRVAGSFTIDARVCVAEIDLRIFAETLNDPWTASSISRFQPIRQDFAIVVDEKVEVQAVEAALRSGAGPLASAIELFDIYRGTGVDPDKKSLAFRLTLSAPDRQLAEYEIDRIRTKIERNVKKQVGGSIRS